MTTKIQQPPGKYSVLFKSSIFGVIRGIIGLPIQHPFDTIKTNMQAYQTNLKTTINEIYKNKGIKGFYSGFLVNVFRIVSRQFYRWPLQISLFGYYGKIFGDTISRAKLGMVCGVNIAIIEVGIITPFQRLKVWLMTAPQNSKMRQFFIKLKVKALFDGMLPVLIKQTIAWVSFLGATQYFKELAYKFTKKDRLTTNLSNFQVLIVSVMSAVVNTFFVMPIDCIKTQYQKNDTLNHNIHENNLKKSKFIQTIEQIYRYYGWRGFFKGWQVKLLQYGINSFFMVFLFQDLLKEYEKAERQRKLEKN